MSDQNYWNTPTGEAGNNESQFTSSNQPTQAFRSGTTDTMPPVAEAQSAQRQTYSYGTPQSQGYSYKNTTSQKTASPGKTFLFAFLGALLAFALAFGGFAAWQGTQNTNVISNNTAQSDRTLGSSDPSVINAIDEGLTLPEAVAAKALPSVAYIGVYATQSNAYSLYGYSMGGQSNELQEVALGSGVVLSDDGYILTNYHVVEGAEAIKVTIEGVEYDADVIGTDPSSDLAVIKAKNATGLTPADIGDSDNLVVGEWVMTVGCPFGLEQSVATGVVSATSRSRIVDDSQYGYGSGYGSSEPTLYPNMIQTDAAINPGNSGGALVDSDGKVIGINTLIASYSGNYSGVGFAIPINYAINIADQIIDGKTPTHAKLGVSLVNVTSQVAKRYNLASDYGAYVQEVSAGSGAESAGIEAGDIIIAFDGEKVSSSTDLTLDVREHNPGDTVTITVNRNGEEKSFDVTLGSDEQELAAVSAQSQQSGTEQQNPYGGNGNSGNRGYEGYSYEDLLHFLDLL